MAGSHICVLCIINGDSLKTEITIIINDQWFHQIYYLSSHGFYRKSAKELSFCEWYYSYTNIITIIHPEICYEMSTQQQKSPNTASISNFVSVLGITLYNITINNEVWGVNYHFEMHYNIIQSYDIHPLFRILYIVSTGHSVLAFYILVVILLDWLGSVQCKYNPHISVCIPYCIWESLVHPSSFLYWCILLDTADLSQRYHLSLHLASSLNVFSYYLIWQIEMTALPMCNSLC